MLDVGHREDLLSLMGLGATGGIRNDKIDGKAFLLRDSDIHLVPF